MVTIKTYCYLPDAFLDKSRLEDVGIIACIPDEQTATIGLGPGFQWIRLQVASEDKDAAEKIIFTTAPKLQAPSDDKTINHGTNSGSVWQYFLGGGIIMALGYAMLGLLSVTTGNHLTFDIGLILSLFVNGGLFGLIFRVFRMRYFPKTKKPIKGSVLNGTNLSEIWDGFCGRGFSSCDGVL
jgi:hypothetical protein